ncbi:conserved exported hypothetical protein [Microbacterium sp. 8M]|jgi:hypothetical protein|uniref:hypothetical protein n=1 Tax=Microbacterium sp. 8M TaxID=2653153 RepID=UPI0012EEF726|nr:hypothetical protein [Microbacterium sp. 8M]VXB74460.1 conserved exported hypothetical protein [Microbacterium sp. 8M]
MSENDLSAGVSRRTVTKAMAWAVPAVAVAATVPYVAASACNDFNPENPCPITLSGTGCKLPGNSQSLYKGYAFRLVIANPTGSPITINVISATLNGQSLGSVLVVNLNDGSSQTNPFSVPAHTTYTAALLTQNATNSSNGSLSITYTVNGGAPMVANATIPSAPPIQGGSCTTFNSTEKGYIAAQ